MFQKQQELAKEKPFLNTEMGQYAFQLGFEYGYKSIIEKACEWINYNNENGGCLFDNWEESFRKAMEE